MFVWLKLLLSRLFANSSKSCMKASPYTKTICKSTPAFHATPSQMRGLTPPRTVWHSGAASCLMLHQNLKCPLKIKWIKVCTTSEGSVACLCCMAGCSKGCYHHRKCEGHSPAQRSSSEETGAAIPRPYQACARAFRQLVRGMSSSSIFWDFVCHCRYYFLVRPHKCLEISVLGGRMRFLHVRIMQ